MTSARPLFFFALALAFASCESVTSPLADLDPPASARPAEAVGLSADWSTRTVALCHPTSKEAASYERIVVTNEVARMHLRHGDELAGGVTFDDACRPVAVASSCGCFEADDLGMPLAGAQPVPYLFSDVFNYYNEDARRTEIRSTLHTEGGLLEEVASVYITETGDPSAPLAPLCFRQDAALDAMTGEAIYTYTTRVLAIGEAEACRLDIETFADGQQTCQGGACDLPYTEEQLDPDYPPYHDGGYRFTATALTILVLGIGANATAFGVVNALLFQAPPFEQPERVVTILQDGDGGVPASTSYPAFLDITRHTDVFGAVAAHTTGEVFLDQGDVLAPLRNEYATASYMDVIGLAPARGSWFRQEHDDPTGPPAAVITWGMWTDRMASDPDVVGQVLRLNGASVTVIGVGPPEFNGGMGPTVVDLWLSISAIGPTGGRVGSLDRRQDHPMTVRARLVEGVSVEDAATAMDRLAGELARDYPELNEGRGISVFPVTETQASPADEAELVPAATLTMAVVILVLVIGTLNLSNLLLVRSAGRSRELAVRLALGAGRARLMRTVTSEAVLLSILGGAGGIGVAVLVARLLRNQRFETALPVLIDLRLDARVIAFTALLSLGAGLVFGLLPAIRSTRRAVSQTVKDGGSSELGGRRRFGLTGLLVTGQIAVSLLLLAISGVFVESLLRAAGADPGFAWEDRIYVEVSLAPLEVDQVAAVLTYDALEERFEQLPGTGEVTRAVRLPGALFGTTTLLLGGAVDGVDRPSEIPWNYVSPDYFDVMEVPLLHGQVPAAGERAPGSVALVTASMARTYWGREDIVGETYRSESNPDESREIVGVVGDATVRVLGEAPVPSLYWPGDVGFDRMNFIMEVDGSESEALAAARAAVRAVDERILIFTAGTLEEHVGATLTRQRLAGWLLAGLGVLALFLAMLGVYGVVSYAVSQRRQEVGIRMALGAVGGSVVRYFVRDVSAVVIVGAVVGLLLALPLGRMIGRVFTGTAANPATTGAVALILLVTSLLATVIPASRAARTDPADALRQE